MSKNYKDFKYFERRPDIVKIFDDLDAYLDFCRFELREFNPADLYKKDSANYQAYLASKRPRRPWVDRGERSHKGQRPHYNRRGN